LLALNKSLSSLENSSTTLESLSNDIKSIESQKQESEQELLKKWNDAHSLNSIDRFSDLYTSTVKFYGQTKTIKEIIDAKTGLLKKYPDSKQQVSLLNVSNTNGILKILFNKDVTVNSKSTRYPSYLEFQNIAGSWKIITEGDTVTDANLAKNQSSTATPSTGDPSKLIRNLLNFAVDNGGINHESEIQQIVTQITSLPKNKNGNKKLARSLNDKGHAFLKDEDFENAIEMFQQAHTTDPFDIEIVNNLGFANIKADNLDDAEKYLLETLVLSPTRSTAWSNLGDVYALQDQENKAIACYANMYRFSKNRLNTDKFIRKVNASEDVESLKTAREKAIRLANSWFYFQ
jgi:tetratricopeptide (TPR) repeat protein